MKCKIFSSNNFWLVEVPEIDVMTQGNSRSDALDMIKDAIECLVNVPGFEISVYDGGGDCIEISSNDDVLFKMLSEKRFHLKEHL